MQTLPATALTAAFSFVQPAAFANFIVQPAALEISLIVQTAASAISLLSCLQFFGDIELQVFEPKVEAKAEGKAEVKVELKS